MKLLIQIILLIYIFQFNAYSGESGDLPEQEMTETMESMFDETENKVEQLDVSKTEELLNPKDNQIKIPKNRLTKIFDQYFFNEINLSKIKILGECQKNLDQGKCLIVDPYKKSKHFNNYFFYTNEQNLVFSIIAFDNKKQGDLNKCKDKVDMWKSYFFNYDLDPKKPDNNSLSFILSDAPQQNSLEIFASCYTESYRDINSSFSLKLYKNG